MLSRCDNTQGWACFTFRGARRTFWKTTERSFCCTLAASSLSKFRLLGIAHQPQLPFGAYLPDFILTFGRSASCVSHGKKIRLGFLSRSVWNKQTRDPVSFPLHAPPSGTPTPLLGGAANRCRGGSRLSAAPLAEGTNLELAVWDFFGWGPPSWNPLPFFDAFPETLFPPFLSVGRPGCRGGALKRLQLVLIYSAGVASSLPHFDPDS